MSVVGSVTIYLLVSCTYCVLYGANSSHIQANKYICPNVCGSSGASQLSKNFITPLSYKARSKLECASACSNYPWCIRYLFRVPQGASVTNISTPSPGCLLYGEDIIHCPSSSGYMAGLTTCERVDITGKTKAEECKLDTQEVLKINNSDVSIIIEYTYLVYLCAAGIDLKVQFVFDTSKLVAKANYYTFDANIPGVICLAATDFLTNLTTNAVPLIVRSLCTNTSVSRNSVYNSGAGFILPTKPREISWQVGKRAKGNLGGNRRVFTTGGNTSELVSAVKAGFSFKLFLHSTYRMVRADIVQSPDVDSGVMTAQATYYENGEQNTLTVCTTGTSDLLAWNLITKKSNVITQSKFDVTWMTDSCWTLVHTSPAGTGSQFSIIKLVTAIRSEGKKIRVGFQANGITMYATANFVGMQSDTEVIAHVMNGIGQTSLFSISNIISIGQTPQWKHFLISSTGNVKEIDIKVGSSQMQETSPKASVVQWFAEAQNYTEIFKGTPNGQVDQIKLARLVKEVNMGNEVRVNIFKASGDRSNYFTCHSLQVTNGGQEVRCQVSGLLAVDFLANTPSTTGTTSSFLGGVLNSLFGGSSTASDPYVSPSSGCPQYLVVSTSGQMTSYIACLDDQNLVKPSVSTSVYTQWFVPQP